MYFLFLHEFSSFDTIFLQLFSFLSMLINFHFPLLISLLLSFYLHWHEQEQYQTRFLISHSKYVIDCVLDFSGITRKSLRIELLCDFGYCRRLCQGLNSLLFELYHTFKVINGCHTHRHWMRVSVSNQ